MRQVFISGIGQTSIKEHWDRSLRALAVEAIRSAMSDAGIEHADALYVGNMLSGQMTGQENLGALLADEAGLHGIEAIKVEAACGSGGAAVHAGYLAIASGLYDTVVVVGVEKLTESSTDMTSAALAQAADADYETIHGASFVALNALLMQRYMYEYGLRREDFAAFPITAHENAVSNPNAMLRMPITMEQYYESRKVADPISVLDAAPVGDGAAAVVLQAATALTGNRDRSVMIAASTISTDCVSLHRRRDLLRLDAAETSAKKAYCHANVTPSDIDIVEVHDAFSIMTVLSLEATGFAERGRGVYLGLEGAISLQGRVPISTMGGLKARGHPVGASGVYQIVEVSTQLRGEAGKNQVPNVQIGMAQSLGGVATNAVTHILKI